MTKFGFSFSRQALAAVSLIALSAAAGCSSVEHTSVSELSAVQTVVPITKPGTETAAYALPTSADPATAAALAALIESRKSNGAETAIAAATTTPDTAATTTTPVVASVQQAVPTQTALVETKPVQTAALTGPAITAVSAMESDFDSGEPVGLETLVAKRMIVPEPKPSLLAAAYNKTTSAISDLVGIEEKPTSSRPELDRMIKHYAELNGIPEALVHRVVKRESTYNPRAYSKGNYGLMQIRYNTARGLGYTGTPEGLFDAETNLKYATKYLRGAWLVADDKNDGAVKLYASGYYYHAKRKGMLDLVQ